MEEKKVKLTPRERNLLIFVVVLLVLFVSWQYYFSQYWASIEEVEEEIEAWEGRVAELERELAEADEIEKELERMEERKEELDVLMPSTNELPMVMYELETMLFEEVDPVVERLRLNEYDKEDVELGELDSDDDDDQTDRGSVTVLPGSTDVLADDNEELLDLLWEMEHFPNLKLVDSIDWDKRENTQSIDFRLFFEAE